MSDNTTPPHFIIVPCRYRTGRELGWGTFAVVKGKCMRMVDAILPIILTIQYHFDRGDTCE
jgi:hypothetical protein